MRSILVTAVSWLVAVGAAYAGPGDFDPTFGSNGKAAVSFDVAGGNLSDRAVAIVPRPGGKLMVVGRVEPAVNGHAVVGFARLTETGSLDGTFGVGGKLTQETLFETIVDAGMDNQDRLLVAGEFRDPNNDDLEFGVMRYLANGQPDAGYGLFGITAAAFDRGGNNEDRIRAISVSPGGEVFAVGRVKIGAASDYDFGVACWTANGALDTAFSGDGLLTVAFDLDGVSAEDDGQAITEFDPNTMRVAGFARRADSSRVAAVASFVTTTGVLTPAFCSGTTCQGAQGSLVPGPGKRTLRFDPATTSNDFVTGAALETGIGGAVGIVGTTQLAASPFTTRSVLAVVGQSGGIIGRATLNLGDPTVATSVAHRFKDQHWVVGGFVGASPTQYGFAAYADETPALDDGFTILGFGGPPLPSAYQVVEFNRLDGAQPVETTPAAIAIDTAQRIVGAGSRLWQRTTGINDNDYAVFRLDDADAIFANGFQND